MSVLSKIRKLLELSRSDNEHEAALAAARAQELILRHNVDEAELAAAGGDIQAEPIEQDTLQSYGRGNRSRVPSWHVILATALGEGFMCRVFWIPGSEIVLVGRTSNRQALAYTWRYLRFEIDRLALEAWRRSGAAQAPWFNPRAGKASWIRGFCRGAADVVAVRMARSKRELAPTSQTAIVLRNRLVEADEWMKSSGTKITAGRHATPPATGYAEGRRAGFELQLETAEGAHQLAEGPKRLGAGDAL